MNNLTFMNTWAFHRTGKKENILVVAEVPGGEPVCKIIETKDNSNIVNAVLMAPNMVNLLVEVRDYLRPFITSDPDHYNMLDKISHVLSHFKNIQ